MEKILKHTHNILNLETNKVEVWTIKKMLEEINRDHSNDFIPHDTNDYLEGWNEWVERGGYYKLADDYNFKVISIENFNEIVYPSNMGILPTDTLDEVDDKINEVVISTYKISANKKRVLTYLDNNADLGFYDFNLYQIAELNLFIAIHK